MPPEYLHFHLAFVRIVRNTGDIFASSFGNSAQVLIALIPDKRAVRLYTFYKLSKRFDILVESGEYIDVIPRNTGQNSYMRVVPKEFGTQVQRRGQILIALKNSVFRCVAQTHHALKTLYLRTYHIIGFDTQALQHIENHRRGRCLSVTTTYDDANLILRLLVQVLGEGVYLNPQFPCTHQLRIVFAGMHTEDDRIDIFGDALGVPTHLVGQQTCFTQMREGGIEDLVVRTRHLVSGLRSHGEC